MLSVLTARLGAFRTPQVESKSILPSKVRSYFFFDGEKD